MLRVAPSPRAVALVLLPALVLMLAFAFSYVGAFHEPSPHQVPIAVVGPAAVTAQLDALPGDPLDAPRASSRADALSQIDNREIYGAYDAARNRMASVARSCAGRRSTSRTRSPWPRRRSGRPRTRLVRSCKRLGSSRPR
jgi:hypothetical protein